MTPAQIKQLRTQLGLSQSQFAARLNEIDPNMQVALTSVSRWERGKRTPDAHSLAALTIAWLDAGYPVTVNGQPGSLTTNHSASSYGLPVIVIDGMAHGPGNAPVVEFGDIPASIREAAARAGWAR